MVLHATAFEVAEKAQRYGLVILDIFEKKAFLLDLFKVLV